MSKAVAAAATQIALRVSADIVDRADALVARIGKNPKMAVGRVTRTSVLKLAIARGLDVLEREHK